MNRRSLLALALLPLAGCQGRDDRLVAQDNQAVESWRAMTTAMGPQLRITMTREDLTDPLKVQAFARAHREPLAGLGPAREAYNQAARAFNATLAAGPPTVDQASGRPFLPLMELTEPPPAR